MRKEYHIDFWELKHAEDYEGEFNDYFIPSQSCAIRVYMPKAEEQFDYLSWELTLYEDLAALGLKRGEAVWVEVDY